MVEIRNEPLPICRECGVDAWVVRVDQSQCDCTHRCARCDKHLYWGVYLEEHKPMTEPESKEALLWIDLETTGLDPITGYILEVAWFITAKSMKPAEVNEYLVDLPYGVSDLDVWTNLAPEVARLHADSRLTHDWFAMDRYSIDEVTAELLLTLPPQDQGWTIYLAGSNCDFERRWLEHWFPTVASQLHHRALDVSRLRTAMGWWRPQDVYAGEPDRPHRAASDIMDHWREARHYREVIA